MGEGKGFMLKHLQIWSEISCILCVCVVFRGGGLSTGLCVYICVYMCQCVCVSVYI